MKRNTLLKTVVVSTVLSAILAGCGSIESIIDEVKDDVADDVIAAVEQSITISGKAVDGYLQYATVCLDISKDGYCQQEEPKAQTTENGSFELDITPQIQKDAAFNEAMLLVYGGKDVDTGADFRGKLLAPADAEVVNISPITTLVAKAVQKELKAEKKLTKEEMKEKIKASKKEVARIFEIDENDITLDPVAVKDAKPELIKHALKIQKAVEAMANASGDNDDIEEIYERLSQNLGKAKDAKGVDSLLDESFQDDQARVNKAKQIARNIDKAFEKLDRDLQKIAYITKEDLKRVKDGHEVGERTDDDDLFKDDHAWDETYIKSDLEDIGMFDPTDEEIAAIKRKIGSDIKPGIVFDYEDDFKNSEDEEFKDIYKKIERKKERIKDQKEKERAKKDGQRVKFEKEMTFYEFDTYDRSVEYSKIHLGLDDIISIEEFKLIDKEFVKEDEEREGEFEDVEYVFKNGNWEQRVDSSETEYAIDSEGALSIPYYNMEVIIANQKDLSGKKLFIPRIKTHIEMPQDSKVSYLAFKTLSDEYVLHQEVRHGDVSDNISQSFATISEFIGYQCNNEYYIAADKESCNGETKEGVLPYGGKWYIETLENDVKILIEEYSYFDSDDKQFYAEREGVLYSGHINSQGFQRDPQPNYNLVAIDAIKKALIEADVIGEDDDYYEDYSGGGSSSTPVVAPEMPAVVEAKPDTDVSQTMSR